jgi:RimJ/RimL family protein N-acetyltransferase
MEDTDNLLSIFTDPVAMLYYPSTLKRDGVEALIQRHLNNYQKYGIGIWAATLKESQDFAGLVGLIPQDLEGRREIEIGYLFLRKYWGRGLATEGAVACRDYGFEKLELERLISLIDPNNTPSIRVAKRIGMKLEREIVKWNKPILVYSIYRDTAT